MRSLWHTGYVVSSLTFLALAYTEWQVPGFVSQVFPLWIVAGIALICGLGSLAFGVTSSGTGPLRLALAVLGGVVLALTIFQAAEVFGAFRLFLALISLVLPGVLLWGLNNDKH
jgi:hypothetical protein